MVDAGLLDLGQCFLGVVERPAVDMDEEEIGAARRRERLELGDFGVVTDAPDHDVVRSAEIDASQTRSNSCMIYAISIVRLLVAETTADLCLLR